MKNQLPLSTNRVIAEVNLNQIHKNLTLLVKNFRKNMPSPEVFDGAVPMIKCNAYGHGLVDSARSLSKSKDVLAIGVATLDEGMAVRSVAGVKKQIWVFSGATPMDTQTVSILKKYELTPVVYNLESLNALLKSGSAKNLKYHLKFNTGMNRLGIALNEMQDVIRMIRKYKKYPEGICTHFGSASMADSLMNTNQIANLYAVLQASLSHINPRFIHAANTAALVHPDCLGIGRFTNVIRPGIGLYGYGSDHGDALGLKPALKLAARVAQVRDIVAGEHVGYDATYVSNKLTTQTILTAGYGDCLHRSLSNKTLLIQDKPVRVMGRISMDISVIETALFKSGSWVTLLGESTKQGERMALEAGTNIYEILTSISARVPRVYKK